MDPQKINRQQTRLRDLLDDPQQFTAAMDLFLHHHAALHSAQMAGTEPWSFEDEILDDLTEEQFRRIPENEEHSIAWNFWHIARIEDTTMNLLAAGTPQVFDQEDWAGRLNTAFRDSGNEMSSTDLAKLSQELNFSALRAYRLVVGRRTREIVMQLTPERLYQKVDPQRMHKVYEVGALVPAAQGIANYWAKRDIAGLLLMPASRHLITHLNESLRLKRKRQ